MSAADLFWLAPALPLATSLLLATGLARARRLPALVSIAALVGSVLASVFALLAATRGARTVVSLPWIEVGGRQLGFAIGVDRLGALAALLVSVVALPVFVYAASYMAEEERQERFFAVFSLFAGAMLVLVLAADLITLFFAWEVVGVCSYLLIGFWFERGEPPAAATKAFLTTRFADLALLAGVLLLIGAVGTGRVDRILDVVAEGRISPDLLVVIALLLFAGAAGKSAQVPFQGWLPDAMAGPTPVSALLHSASMVAAGVFLIARLYPLFLAAGPALDVVAWIGAATALLGAAAALVEADLKRLLAYSTMSQLGLMMAGLGAGSLLAGVFLLVAQALYKAPLFLAAGAVDHVVGGTSIARMGGLRRRMPWTFGVFALAAAALAGLPVTLALPPKDPVLAAAWGADGGLFAALLLASLLTALYSARAVGLAFLGAPSDAARRAEEAPAGLLAPMLAFAGLLVMGLLADAPLLGHPLERILGAPAPDAPAATALALGAAGAGTGLGLWALRAWPTALVWPPLRPLAPIFAAEFGFRPLYRALPRWGLRAARALDAFDRTVFVPLSDGLARGALRGAHAAGALDRRYFDPLGGGLARGVVRTAHAAGALDRMGFDAATGALAKAAVRMVRAGARFDLRGLEAAFVGFGRAILALSHRFRALQTGRIENYLLGIILGGVGVIALAALVLTFR